MGGQFVALNSVAPTCDKSTGGQISFAFRFSAFSRPFHLCNSKFTLRHRAVQLSMSTELQSVMQ